MSTQYRVVWEIDITADSPREAAEKALKIQRDRNSIATVFDVFEKCKSERVDLSEEVDPCPMCWCSDCCSYHADPKDEQHHKELQCSRPWPEWEKIMKEENEAT